MRQFILTACVLASLAVASAQITPVTNAAFYPYGPGTADILDGAADDGTSGAVSLATPFPFFGNIYNELFVNTNGDISFGGAVTGFTPTAFPVTNNRVLAVYFTDIKTSNGGRSGYIYRRETTDAAILARATTDIQTALPADHGSFEATWVYIATWHEVGIFGAGGAGLNLRNTFQLVLISDGCKSFTLFNYDQIQFLQGSTNGGSGETGTGPNPAQVGINGGDGIHYSLHPSSRTTDLYNLPTWTDPAVPGPPGRWVQRTDLALTGDGPALVCPAGFREFGDDLCLKFHVQPLDYSEAIAKCAELAPDGRLFNIRSQAHNEMLIGFLQRFQTRTGRGRGFWIGLTDLGTEGTFKWEDETPFDTEGYTNWAEGALEERQGGERDCVFMNKEDGWKWNIQKCETRRERNAFICTAPKAPVASDC
ncbi:sushi, nidogen and EGF-like domain-containing protein 1 [Branchiostoma floridae x Branchiostoma japonicum]